MEYNNDTLHAGDSWNPPYHPIIQAFGWIIATALSLETILGNAMVVLAYHLERSISKQLNNQFIVSLAVSDLIIGIEGIPFFTIYVINGDRWPLGAIACETWLFLDYTLCLVSILTVLLITADRYLSVCHTARYLKWQTPFRVQMLIFSSWVLPALIFGLMIYGWPLIGDKEQEIQATSNGECYAPFLANPFVNMSMYIFYYWTTLFAMLILYKGIHKAAKKLEKRSRAREHRHIALLLTQRLGTQVGVGLMLHARKHHEEVMKTKQDSGYTTNNTLSTTESSDRRRSSFAILVKAVQNTQKLAQFRGRGTTFAFRSNSNEGAETPRSNRSRQIQIQTGQHLERLSEQNSQVLTDDTGEIPESEKTQIEEQSRTQSQSVQSIAAPVPGRRIEMIYENKINTEYDEYYNDDDDDDFPTDMIRHRFDSGAQTSLSTEIFHDESLSSVLHFNQSAMGSPLLDLTHSDSSSELTIKNFTISEKYKNGDIKKRNCYSLSSNPRNRSARQNPMTTGSLKEQWRRAPIEIYPLAQLETSPSFSINNTNTMPTEILTEQEDKYQIDEKCHDLLCPIEIESQELSPAKETIAIPQEPIILSQKSSVASQHSHQSLRIPMLDKEPLEESKRRTSTSTSSSHHRSGEKRSTSRKSSHQGVQKQQQNGQRTLFGRIRHQIYNLFQMGFGLNSPESNMNLTSIRDPLAVNATMHNSRSFSSMSSISSSTQPGIFSKRTSVLLAAGQQQQIQIPTLTITRDSLGAQTQTSVPTTVTCEIKDSPTHLQRNEDARRSSGFLQALFAPISTFQRRRKKTKAERRAHKAFRTITFIVGLFAILWSPYYVVATIYGFCRSDCIPSFLYNISYYMCYLNSSLNPFAYALANRQFRTAFSKILRGNFRQSN